LGKRKKKEGEDCFYFPRCRAKREKGKRKGGIGGKIENGLSSKSIPGGCKMEGDGNRRGKRQTGSTTISLSRSARAIGREKR